MNTNRFLLISIFTYLSVNPVFGQESSGTLDQTKTTNESNNNSDYTAAKKAILLCYEYTHRVTFYHESTTEDGQESCKKVPSLKKPLEEKCSDGNAEACKILKEIKESAAKIFLGGAMNGDSSLSESKVPKLQQEDIKNFIDQTNQPINQSGQHSNDKAKITHDMLKHRKSLKEKCFKGEKEACKADVEWTKEFLKQLILAPKQDAVE